MGGFAQVRFRFSAFLYAVPVSVLLFTCDGPLRAALLSRRLIILQVPTPPACAPSLPPPHHRSPVRPRPSCLHPFPPQPRSCPISSRLHSFPPTPRPSPIRPLPPAYTLSSPHSPPPLLPTYRRQIVFGRKASVCPTPHPRMIPSAHLHSLFFPSPRPVLPQPTAHVCRQGRALVRQRDAARLHSFPSPPHLTPHLTPLPSNPLSSPP
jgi:hypothetical protein